MIVARYSYRPHAFSRERNFWLEPNALGWSYGNSERRVDYRDIEEARLYRLFMRRSGALRKKIMWRLHLHCRSGERIVVSPLHCVRFRTWEDRSAAYLVFANAVLSQLDPADAKVVAEQHWTMRLRSQIRGLASRVLLTLVLLARGRDPDRITSVAGRFMRVTGPWLRGQRVARGNLIAAFPEKSRGEINSILQGMWENFGRVIAEYAFLEQLSDFDRSEASAGRIVADQATLERAVRIRDRGKPVLFFGAHLANWELPPAAAASFGVNLAAVYRPPGFVPLARDSRDRFVRGTGRH